MGKSMASETAYAVDQGINYSEIQTEKYFEQHANLMERVRQRMLDAAQYYTTFNESSKQVYMNNMDETVMLEIEGLDNLLPHYNIHLQSRANVKAALKTMSDFLIQENTLPIAPSAKLEALVSYSVPKILNLIKTSELEQIKIQREQQEAEMQQQQQQFEMEQQLELSRIQNENDQNELDRQKDIKIAEIRAMGGLQSDINTNGTIDSQENLAKLALQQQDIETSTQMKKDELSQKSQIEKEKIIAAREKALADLEAKKYVADTQLKIAKENTRKKG
jgi:hypothetical protein